MIEIEFENPLRGGKITFDDSAQAMLFAQDEVKRWHRAMSTTQNALADPLDQQAFLTPVSAWANVERELDTLRRAQSSDDRLINDVNLVLLDSIVGRSLTWVFQTFGAVAAHAAALSEGVGQGDINWSDEASFRGVFAFEWVKSRIDTGERRNALRAKNKDISELESRVNEIHESIRRVEELSSSAATLSVQQADQIRNEYAVFQAEASTALHKARSDAENLATEIKLAIENGETKTNLAISSAQKQVDDWISAHNEEKQLAAPAKLWADRAIIHSRQAAKWRWWALGVGIFGLGSSVFISGEALNLAHALFLNAVTPGKTASSLAGTIRPTFYYELVFSAAVTLAWLTMYLWAMRVLIRLYTTEHHLSIDASARGAMNETYLGLIAAGAANEKDRAVVLSALFRPVQDGIVRDDGPPGIGPAAILSGLITAKTGGH